jgi:hypothetical protein
MTYPAPVLPDLLVGWQKVADRYNMPIYVFLTGDTFHAVSNEAQGVGHLVDTPAPREKSEFRPGTAWSDRDYKQRSIAVAPNATGSP